eukprot:s6091_g4.t1
MLQAIEVQVQPSTKPSFLLPWTVRCCIALEPSGLRLHEPWPPWCSVCEPAPPIGRLVLRHLSSTVADG